MRKRDEGSADGVTRLAYTTAPTASATKPIPPTAPSPADRMPRAVGGKGIRLRLEARPGGRAVTLVLGLQGTEAEIASLAKLLKSSCGAGGTVKDGVIELQGDHRASAQAAMAERGLKARI